MNKTTAYIDRLLSEWGRYRCAANNTGINWSAETLISRMMKYGQIIRSSRSDYSHEDEVSETINAIIIAMSMFKRDQAKALITYYEHPDWTIETCARKENIPPSTFSERLRAGRESVLRAYETRDADF